MEIGKAIRITRGKDGLLRVGLFDDQMEVHTPSTWSFDTDAEAFSFIELQKGEGPWVIPPDMRGPVASSMTPHGLTLTWPAVPGSKGYKVYRNGEEIAEPAGTSFVDKGLVSGTTYTYTVAPVEADGRLGAQSKATPVIAG